MDIQTKPLKRKILNVDELRSAASANGRPVVFTNGVFDLLHAGHVTYLEQAKTMGRSLFVGVNSDDSVKRLGKGDNRPFNKLMNRMIVLAALECVDYVVPFEHDTPIELIKIVKPDILVKGGDWKIENIIGSTEVASWGGRTISIPF
ncbi:MAG: adenylyltransferase/cytidyltransferase family protein, partial [Betaproteobacteria bacterium]